MSRFLALSLRRIGMALIQRFGSRIVDERTGKVIGRALLIPWRGRIQVVGLEQRLRPVFLAQTRLTYWRQTLGFSSQPEVDFPSERTRS